MQAYLKTQKIVARHLYFYYRNKKFFGQGIIKWDSETGFEIDILLENPGLTRVEGRGLRVSNTSDFCSIRIWTDEQGWALIPSIDMHRFETSLLGKHVSIKFSRMYFCEAGASPQISDLYWTGNSLFRFKGINEFSDIVNVQTDIQGQPLRTLWDKGFLYEENDYKITGYLIDENLFHVTWRLPKALYTKGQAWNWSIGFQEALQIWLGRTIPLLKREMNRNTHKIIEFRRETEIKSLGKFRLIASNFVQNEAIIALAKFFCMEESKLQVEVCRNIFNQIMDARQQRTQAAQELLVATTLEATIRTLYNHPLHKKDNSRGLVEQTLKGKFKKEYLCKKWNHHCESAVSAFKRLRDRNAHPDWLAAVGDPNATERVRSAVDDMLYLCRFYGYMILAIAGLRVENPYFPTPHQQWESSFVISSPEDPVGLPASPLLSQALNLPRLPFEDLPENSGYHAKMMAFRRFKLSLRDYQQIFFNQSIEASSSDMTQPIENGEE